jgi:hypothetical protein
MSVTRHANLNASRAATVNGASLGPSSDMPQPADYAATVSASLEARIPPFHFVNVTWGQGHTGIFLDVSLPSQLSAGNLHAFQGIPGTLYKIYTTVADAKRIRQSPGYQRLCELVPTQLIEMKIDCHAPNHQALTDCQKKAIEEAEVAGAAVVFLAPDTVVADGGFVSLLRLAAAGKRAVMVAGVRLNKETFVPAYLEQCRPQGEVEAGISSRELVALAIDHLHPISKSLVWPPKSVWPSHLYWLVEREGFLGRCYHLHPVMVVTAQDRVSFSSTIDGDYVLHACREGEVHIVEDSDELTLLEISPERYEMGPSAIPMRESQIGRWACLHANALHQSMLGRTIRFHRRELTPEWQRIQAESDFVVHTIYCRMRAWAKYERIAQWLMPLYRLLRPPGRFVIRAMRSVRSRTHRLMARLLRLTSNKDRLAAQPKHTNIAASECQSGKATGRPT